MISLGSETASVNWVSEVTRVEPSYLRLSMRTDAQYVRDACEESILCPRLSSQA